MAKKNAGDIKKEAAKLKEVMAGAKKKSHNFALMIGKDGLVFEADVRKPPAALRRMAKSNGGGAKGASGVMTVSGKLVVLQCDDENVPKMLPKLAKKHFSERGMVYKFEMKLPGGKAVDGDDEPEQTEQTSAPPPEADTQSQGAGGSDTAQNEDATTGAREEKLATARTALNKVFGNMSAELENALSSVDKNAAKKISFLARSFEDEVLGNDLKRAGTILSLLKKTISDAAAKAEQAARKAAGGDDGVFSGLKDLAEKVGDVLGDSAENTGDAISDAAQSVAGAQSQDETADQQETALTPKQREEILSGFGKMEAELDDLMAELA